MPEAKIVVPPQILTSLNLPEGASLDEALLKIEKLRALGTVVTFASKGRCSRARLQGPLIDAMKRDYRRIKESSLERTTEYDEHETLAYLVDILGLANQNAGILVRHKATGAIAMFDQLASGGVYIATDYGLTHGIKTAVIGGHGYK